MRRFLIKLSILAVALVVFNLLLLFLVPKDKNSYLSEYTTKVELLEKTPQPRMVFIGGSNLPFGINSKLIGEAMNRHVINFGLHGGLGVRYLLTDCRPYLKRGDVAVLQFEYEHFYNSGQGESYLLFMMANNWRKCYLLDFAQWRTIISEIPSEAMFNLKRLRRSITKHTLDTPVNGKRFDYAKSGFNEWGDEVAHFQYPSTFIQPDLPATKVVDPEFFDWLAATVAEYEKAGIKVVMLPPVCVESQFKTSYNEEIAKELNRVHLSYIIEPDSMVLPDSCAFNTGYHLNQKGVELNTRKIIRILSSKGGQEPEARSQKPANR